MPKINQEEYELLKGLDDKWKWIARDKNSRWVWLFKEKPCKSRAIWEGDSSGVHYAITKGNFCFIQWEDEEPHNIAELIKEYEFGKILLAMAEEETVLELELESEETEVKNIEWVKEEIGELPCVDTVFNSDGSSYIDSAVPVMAVYDLLDQLDEPETPFIDKEQLVKRIENYIPLHDKTVGDVVDGILETIKQLPDGEMTLTRGELNPH